MLVEPECRGQRIPTRFIEHLKSVASTIGYGFLLGPFRPSGYGKYKEQTRKAHSPTSFVITATRQIGWSADRRLAARGDSKRNEDAQTRATLDAGDARAECV